MTRRIVWLTLLAVGMLVLGGAWFAANYERVPVKERLEEEPEARRNPYLAFERFLARMGRPVKRQSDIRDLDGLPADGVLILDRNRRRQMTPDRVDRIMAWVKAGGYLIVVPEWPTVSDPICHRLGVTRFDRGDEEPATDDEEDGESPAAPDPASMVKPPARPKTITVDIPGADRPLVASFRTAGRQPGELEPDWEAGDDAYGDQFLHYGVGRGQITVADGLMQLLDNHDIGDNDHAELIWTLIQTYQPNPSAPVILMSKFKVPTLWDWLAESAWTILVAGAALLGLWLWRILPRFGPVVPEPEPGRRELREHLAAIGRYVWRTGGLDHWLGVAREDFTARLALRHPAIAALPAEDQAGELARLSDRPASLIAAALHGPAASPHAFTQALRTLRNLERSL
jgi:hypothetical protein